MAVTQYIGARYVPLFADPIDWDNTKQYEPLTIVYHQGNSFTSKQFVPTGIDIANGDYWVLTGNYNAQVEQYRREVQTFGGRITANAQAIADEVSARMSEDTAIRGIIADLQGDLSDEVAARTAADTQIRTDFADADTQIRTDFASADTALSNRILNFENKTEIMVIVGDSYGEGFVPGGATDNSKGWCNRLKELIQTSHPNVTCLVDYVNGGRLATDMINKATTMLNNIANDDRKKVTKIVIAGGYNDARFRVGESEFNTFFATFAAFVKSNFPNAEVYISAIGGTISFKTVGKYASTTSRDCFTAYLWAKNAAEANGFVFDDGSFATLIRYGWFASDYVHPNETGNYLIAKRLFKLIYTGQGYFPGLPFSDECPITAIENGRLEEPCNMQAAYSPEGFCEQLSLTGAALGFIKIAYDTPRQMNFAVNNYYSFANCSIPAISGMRAKFPATVSVRESETGKWYSGSGVILLTTASADLIVAANITTGNDYSANVAVDRLYVQPTTTRQFFEGVYNA